MFQKQIAQEQNNKKFSKLAITSFVFAIFSIIIFCSYFSPLYDIVSPFLERLQGLPYLVGSFPAPIVPFILLVVTFSLGMPVIPSLISVILGIIALVKISKDSQLKGKIFSLFGISLCGLFILYFFLYFFLSITRDIIRAL